MLYVFEDLSDTKMLQIVIKHFEMVLHCQPFSKKCKLSQKPFIWCE